MKWKTLLGLIVFDVKENITYFETCLDSVAIKTKVTTMRHFRKGVDDIVLSTDSQEQLTEKDEWIKEGKANYDLQFLAMFVNELVNHE